MVLRPGVEVGFGARHRGREALVAPPQLPPAAVVIGGRDLPREHLPAPLIDQPPEGQEGDLLEGHLHLLVDERLAARGDGVDEPDPREVGRGHREIDGIADGLVEAVIGAVAEQERLARVADEVVDVPELVVDRVEILLGGGEARLDAHIASARHVPGARVADHLAIARAREHRALPEGLRQLRKPERGVEALRRVSHARRIPLLRLEERIRRLEAGGRVGPEDIGVDLVPLLRPHVAEELRGDRLAGGHLVLAVAPCEPGARIAVQPVVERLHLLPQPLRLGVELLGRHVIAGAPHDSQVLEAELARALVRKPHELAVLLAHAGADGVPALPGVGELGVVAAPGEDLRELVEIHAGTGPVRTVLALAVLGLELRLELREARALRRIVGRGSGDVQAQLHERPPRCGRELLSVVALGFRDRLAEVGEVAVVGPGVEELRVGGDVGVERVARGLRLLGERVELAIDARDELIRALLRGGSGRRGRGRGALARRAAGQERATGQEDEGQRACRAGSGSRLRHGYLTPAIIRRAKGVSANITRPPIAPYPKIFRNRPGRDSRWLASYWPES